MLKDKFISQEEFNVYIAEQKVRQEKGYLTRSEREVLKVMLDKEYKPRLIEQQANKISLISDINLLRKPCQEVTKDDDIKDLVKRLKESLEKTTGVGLTANQIGINKRISYVKIPKLVDKKIEDTEYILINAKIVEKDRLIKISNESCLSFPGIDVATERYVFITVEYMNEKLELKTGVFQDLESLVIQHEIAHQLGRTIFDDKWKSR